MAEKAREIAPPARECSLPGERPSAAEQRRTAVPRTRLFQRRITGRATTLAVAVLRGAVVLLKWLVAAIAVLVWLVVVPLIDLVGGLSARVGRRLHAARRLH